MPDEQLSYVTHTHTHKELRNNEGSCVPAVTQCRAEVVHSNRESNTKTDPLRVSQESAPQGAGSTGT